MTDTVLGSETVQVEPSPDGDGVEIPINDAIVNVLDIDPDEPIDITISATPEGEVVITGDLPVDELTDEQRAQLAAAFSDEQL